MGETCPPLVTRNKRRTDLEDSQAENPRFFSGLFREGGRGKKGKIQGGEGLMVCSSLNQVVSPLTPQGNTSRELGGESCGTERWGISKGGLANQKTVGRGCGVQSSVLSFTRTGGLLRGKNWEKGRSDWRESA